MILSDGPDTVVETNPNATADEHRRIAGMPKDFSILGVWLR